MLFRRPQCDLVLQGTRLAADELGPDVAQQSCHRRIVGRDQRGEAADAFGAGTLRQLSHQFGAESQTLPVVDDGDRDFGGLWGVGVADIAGDTDTAPVGVIQRAERLVVVMVKVGEVAQRGW